MIVDLNTYQYNQKKFFIKTFTCKDYIYYIHNSEPIEKSFKAIGNSYYEFMKIKKNYIARRVSNNEAIEILIDEKEFKSFNLKSFFLDSFHTYIKDNQKVEIIRYNDNCFARFYFNKKNDMEQFIKPDWVISEVDNCFSYVTNNHVYTKKSNLG